MSTEQPTARMGRPAFYCIAALLFLYACSVGIRLHDIRSTAGVSNLEATYHTLLTVKALQESPVQQHWFLPTVSLGTERDKHVSWGATLPIASGDYVYTSFTPPMFLLPYLVFSGLHMEVSAPNLAYLNLVLQLVSCILFYYLLASVIGSRSSAAVRHSCALLGTSVLLFSHEALTSFGLVYWAQQLWLPVFLVQLILFHRIVSGRSGKALHTDFALVSFFVAYIEWSGMVSNVSLAAFTWWLGGKPGNEHLRRLSVPLVAATAGAVAFFLIHLAMVSNWNELVATLKDRFHARSSGTPKDSLWLNLKDLRAGYGQSFGWLFAALAVAAGLYIYDAQKQKDAKSMAERLGQSALLVLAAACMPLLENLVLQKHALLFSYDRLKAALVIGLLLAFLMEMLESRRILIASLVAVALVQNVALYSQDKLRNADWERIDAANHELKQQLEKMVDFKCTAFATNHKVRGYANLLFGRAIYENAFQGVAVSMMKKTHACAAVFLDERLPFPEYALGGAPRAALPEFTRAAIILPKDAPKKEPVEVENIDFTDRNWKHGIGTRLIGVLLENTEESRAAVSGATHVHFAGSGMRRVTGLGLTSKYIDVYVDGEPLDPAKDGYPEKLRFE